MKNKINIRFMMIAAAAIILTSVLTTILYYQVFQKEVFDNLKNICFVLEKTDLIKENTIINSGQYMGESDNLRITIIGTDGLVRFDTNGMVNPKENHKNRPEIAEAIKSGQGKSIRTSKTINKSNYYYAVLIDNGCVLRVSKEARSIINIFLSALPTVLVIMLVLFILCIIIGNYLTKNLIKPIEQTAANLDHLEQVETYRELVPFIDIIRKQHEDILKSAKIRQEFTANVSHELKTPLTSILGYSELIKNGMVGEKDIERFAGEIHRNAKRLISLINDILKLSELDSGNAHFPRENVDLYELANNCIIMLDLIAVKRGIKLHLEGKTTYVNVNKELFEEVIYNLCDNAIRYNHDGGNVWINVGESLTVKDDGIGISPEHRERIFERFYRVDKSRSKKTGGTGLGLAIVKHIVELHDGSISLESEEGKGTTITVQLR